MDSNKVYIRVNKSLCTQTESKYENRPYYNIMKLPKGTVIGDTDLSYAIINPIVMVEDAKNPRMYCAIYDKDKLKDNAVKVYMNIGNEKRYMPVDVDALRDAVAAANHAYYEEHKAEKTRERENTAEPRTEGYVHEKAKEIPSGAEKSREREQPYNV